MRFEVEARRSRTRREGCAGGVVISDGKSSRRRLGLCESVVAEDVMLAGGLTVYRIQGRHHGQNQGGVELPTGRRLEVTGSGLYSPLPSNAKVTPAAKDLGEDE